MILLPQAHSPIFGEVLVPGSKSETNRVLVLAGLASGPSNITGALRSRDAELMLAALRSLGVGIQQFDDGSLQVHPPQQLQPVPAGIDCGLAGTVMRFVPPLCLLTTGTTYFYGDPHASQRPMAGLLAGLRQLGATVLGDELPFEITAGSSPAAHEVLIDASASSQFISGLLLVGARLPGGLKLRHSGTSVPSLPHIEMSIAMLRQRGVEIAQPDETSWQVSPGPIAALDCQVEPDLTNAAVFLAAAALTGGKVSIPGWPKQTTQPGALFLDVAARMGARIETSADTVSLVGGGQLTGIDVDLHAASELTPVVAALAALANGKSRIRGVGHIRGHETDRIRALATELAKLGVEVTEFEDGLEITGTSQLQPKQSFETYADHRMVHAAALLALVTPGLAVTDLDCVGKTMPDFPQRWAALLGV